MCMFVPTSKLRRRLLFQCCTEFDVIDVAPLQVAITAIVSTMHYTYYIEFGPIYVLSIPDHELQSSHMIRLDSASLSQMKSSH